MTRPVVEIMQLVREFGAKRAINDLSLELSVGRILALLGPNGAGKTTLLKLLAGLLMPTEGEARVLGAPSFPQSRAIASRVGCVLDGVEPPARALVRHVLQLKASAVTSFDAARARQLCEAHDIQLKQRWRTLSKGQKRWVLAVSALVSGAELLLLDEPADGLDPVARQELYGLLRAEVNNRETTVIVASHILSDVEKVADEVGIVKDGQLQLQGDLEDLRDRVREIEFASELPITSSLPPATRVLGRDESAGSRILWLEYENADEADTPLANEVQRRAVNLERLYFAITQHREEPHADAVSELETVSST